MKKQYLECGKIVSMHGVRGEVNVLPWCDSPEYICGFERLHLNHGETALEVERARVHKNMALLKLKGFDSLDDAARLRGKVLYIDRDDDASGGVFLQDLIGLAVVDADSGEAYGKLADVVQTGANDVYVVRDASGRERLVPAIPQVIAETDIDGGTMHIRPLKGLFDEN